MKKSFIISGSIVFILILIFGIYFFTRGNKPENLIIQKNKLQSDIVLAKDKLSKEKQILDTMVSGLFDSYPLAVNVQDQMKKASDIVSQTDFMFTDSSGLNPEIIVKNIISGFSINNERKNINLLISRWKQETDILSIKKIDINESNKIKQDTETIKTYIQNLSQIVGSFTTGNSGLSQLQIDSYLAQLPSIEVINEVLASLGTAIENANNPPASNPETQNSPASPNPPPVAPPVVVTPSDVIREQAIVAEAQRQADILQEQLALIETQLPLPPAPTAPTPVPTPIEINPTNNPDYINPYNINSADYQGIIIQPGPPQLIQGTNQF